MIKIGIDCRSLGSKKKSGVENYLLSLVEGVADVDKNIHYYYYVDNHSRLKDLEKFKRPNASIIKVPTKNEKIFMFLLNLIVWFSGIDLFCFPVSTIPANFQTPSAIVIHDLTYEIYPEFYTPHELKLQKIIVKRSAQVAKGIITNSESTKKDLVKFYNIDPSKIYVIYPEISEALKREHKDKKAYNYKYILCVGNIQPRKNFINIIKAFAELPNKDLHLIIVGKKQDLVEYEKIKKLVNKYKLVNRVHITGYVTNKELRNLYRDSELLLYPSFYEGFGFPIVEAFANSAPVITSNISSMPEVAGNAALYVDPTNYKSIKEGIIKFFNKNFKNELIEKVKKG